jgi:hypothetical protein
MMALSTTVTVSEQVAQKLQELARVRRQNVNVTLETLVNQAWLQAGAETEGQIEPNPASDDVATPEMQAYLTLHPMLKEKYLGQYVAIYQGALIDHDTDHEALYQRIDAQYPNEFVWISQVEREPIPTLISRSIRMTPAAISTSATVVMPRPGTFTAKLWGALGQGTQTELDEVFSYDYDYELSQR